MIDFTIMSTVCFIPFSCVSLLTFRSFSCAVSGDTTFCRPDPNSQFRLAIGSYVEQYSNAVQIVKKRPADNSMALESQLYKACEFDHPYPCTKILWSPDVSATKDLLATTGDYLRVWSATDDGSGTGMLIPKKVALLNNVCTEKKCAAVAVCRTMKISHRLLFTLVLLEQDE